MLDFLQELLPSDNPPNMFTELMGELVKKARVDAGISQAELARRMFTRQATISNIENGKKNGHARLILFTSARF